ncbi:uncharacterized protein LY89DRAFT_738994 [Mollisia scopiformis]|uniref:2EXR domain-containing protein n=1 Tax=Mollisia scopiformis TaxID=149040 RepID=A0A194WUC7_MOLSC|nr:uncharacterized protein LY89DRAFT_738994 [Mollisia scopiformis]KUJ11566.1 hypothetical protein LY89DRAFT_738994 [Mollisia scopiformis]
MELDKFHKFPELPVELRREIWKLTPLHSRTIEIGVDFAGPDELSGLRFSSFTDNPGTLSANKESREITLPFYQIILGGDHTVRRGTLYCNFDKDIVSFFGEDFEPLEGGAVFQPFYTYRGRVQKISWIARERFEKIQKVIINNMLWSPHQTNLFQPRGPNLSYGTRTFQKGLFFGHFPELREVTLVARTGREGCGCLYNPRFQREALEGKITRMIIERIGRDFLSSMLQTEVFDKREVLVTGFEYTWRMVSTLTAAEW